MKRVALSMIAVLAVTCAATGVARAQFALPEETNKTKWGGTVYAGGDVDSLGNFQYGARASYRILEIDPIGRAAPEIGVEFRKNYALFKIGGRADSRELLRLSAFVGGGVMRIQDFTNQSGDSDIAVSDETWYYYFGGKFRMPGLGGIPIIGGILGAVPIEGVSIFAGQEINGLDPPEPRGNEEFEVDEWYTHSVQFGVMIGSAGGWFR